MGNGNEQNGGISIRSCVGDRVSVMMPGHMHPYNVVVTRVITVTYYDRGWERYTPQWVYKNWGRLMFSFDERKGNPKQIAGICRHSGGRYYELKIGAREDDPAGTRLEIEFSNGDRKTIESWLVLGKAEEKVMNAVIETPANEPQGDVRKISDLMKPLANEPQGDARELDLHDVDEIPVKDDAERKGANRRKREQKIAARTAKMAVRERREELVGAGA